MTKLSSDKFNLSKFDLFYDIVLASIRQAFAIEYDFILVLQ